MSILSFLFFIEAAIASAALSAQYSERDAIVIWGDDLSIINKAARKAGLNPEQLNCYDISISRQNKTVTVGFVPKSPVIISGGKLQRVLNNSCKAHSFLYTDNGRFIRRLGIRDHPIVR